jgi:hypothetical protein
MTVGLESQGNNAAPAYLTTPDFFARLKRDSATQISIQNHAGTVVEVNAERVAVGSSGFTLLNTANLIAADGTDSGGAPAVDTLYYCYVSNSKASFAPLGIRMSATAPSLFNGVKYLATTGNGANWRFVGWVRTISNAGTVNYADSLTQRLVINYYNRRRLSLETTPGYVDDNTNTTYTLASATYIALNGGTGSQLAFISNGEDATLYSLQATVANNGIGNRMFIGVGEDSTSQASTTQTGDASVAGSNIGLNITRKTILAEGYRLLNALGRIGAGTNTYIADVTRGGGATDPPCTTLSAEIMG